MEMNKPPFVIQFLIIILRLCDLQPAPKRLNTMKTTSAPTNIAWNALLSKHLNSNTWYKNYSFYKMKKCGVLGLEWTNNHQCTNPRWDRSAILGMNQKHILSPAQGFFRPLLYPKIFPSYLPTSPPPSLNSFLTHSISKVQESSWAWVA